jgi:DNA topoisomerase-1
MGSELRDVHVAAAEAAGLRYVTDDEPGIIRRGVGRGFAYYGPTGERIAARAERRRIASLAIPPAWTEVWICPDPNGHITATGRDAKGRKQYRYHPRFRALRDESKFGRMLTFSAALPRLRDRVERDLNRPGLERRKLLATLVRLLDKTLIRIGNEEYARANRSYGLTTLTRRHVEVRGHTLRFDFRGKSGVEHSVALADRRLARIVRHLQDLPGQQLFKYVDGDGKRQTVDSDDVNAYLREATGLDVTAKDFRTWSGTMLAVSALRASGPPASEREARRNVNSVLDQVARRLGNTRAVCRQYYVHPAVIAAYHRGVTAPTPPKNRRGRERPSAALRRDEVLTLQFIQSELGWPNGPVPANGQPERPQFPSATRTAAPTLRASAASPP